VTDDRSATGPGGGKRRIILLMGAAGAGKGTQADRLAVELGTPHLASGNLFRAAIAARTELGARARVYMDRGELVPDALTISMFMDELSRPSAERGAILDGFPRTVGQAAALDSVLAGRGDRIDAVVYIEVPNDVLVERLAGRWVCPTCGTPYHELTDPPAASGRCDRDGTDLVQRDDDRPEVVRARLERQIPPMLEVIDHYDRSGRVVRVDGRQSIDAVTSDIMAHLAARADGRA